MIPQHPAEDSAEARPAYYSHGRHSAIEDSDKATTEDGNGCKMLHNNGGVEHERPELIWLQAWISLQGIKERLLVRVVIRNCEHQNLLLIGRGRHTWLFEPEKLLVVAIRLVFLSQRLIRSASPDGRGVQEGTWWITQVV